MEYLFMNGLAYIKDHDGHWVNIYFEKGKSNEHIKVTEDEFKNILSHDKHSHSFSRGIYFYDQGGFYYIGRHCAVCNQLLETI